MKHQGTKQLETKRLILRRPQLIDAEDMFNNWACSEKVTKYLSWKSHTSIEQTKSLLTIWEKESQKINNYNWLIVLKETNKPIGGISVVNINENTNSVMLGYCLGESWWGKELTKEALERVIEFLFNEVEVNMISATHDPLNPNSGKVMKKCLMHYDGRIRSSYINNQGLCDEVWYTITKEDYQKEHDEWDLLYNYALKVQNGRVISNFIEAGGVAAAILSKDLNVYTGVCIDTACSLGMCAERNAVANMLTNNEYIIKKLVAIMPNGKVGLPCGACRELLMQLTKENKELEILVDIKTKETIKLKDLLIDWWGEQRY